MSDCWDAVGLGVHPPRDTLTLPPYVERDAEPQVSAAIVAGGLVIVQGPSLAGKTRLAFETMRRTVPDRRVFIPYRPHALRDLMAAGDAVRDAVVWLDDIALHLDRGWLDRELVDALCPRGRSDVVLLATLKTDPGLDSALVIPLERVLTDAERQRAAHHVMDPRIATALEAPAVGFAEHLAAGPEALTRWQAAQAGEHPSAGAIITAAVRARQGGNLDPLPRAMLEERHARHLPEGAQPADFEAGLAWALEPVSGARGCLVALPDDCYAPLGYLVDAAPEPEPEPEPEPHRPPPAGAASRPTIVEHAGPAAPRRQRPSAPTVAANDPEGAFRMGVTHLDSGLKAEAALWFRRAATAGHAEAMNALGELFQESGRSTDAERWFRHAAESGHLDAMNALAVVLRQDGRRQEAERWLQRAAEAGQTLAMVNLAAILTERIGRKTEAERWLRRAANAGDVAGMAQLAGFLTNVGRHHEAEQWYREVAQHIDPAEQAKLRALIGLDDPQEAMPVRKAAEAGDVEAMTHLGNALSAKQDPEAETWLRRAAEAGHGTAMKNLAVLMQEAGRTRDADTWFRRAADAGVVDAMVFVGASYERAGQVREAERWYRKAADGGDPIAMNNLGVLLWELDVDRTPEAERWLRRAADEGVTAAMGNLGRMLNELGRTKEGQGWLARERRA